MLSIPEILFLLSPLNAMDDDLYVLPFRAKEAQRIYQEIESMTEAMHITDAIFAYLSSGWFLALVTIYLVARYFTAQKKA